ncbi:MAG: DNA alkylation repair protein, partial [Alistipes onderdonkii]
MDYTSRMVALLRELRRERNGAVADSMRYYGTPYGLNYGVSLPTLRRIARAEAPDHGFARYLYRQDVRELRLAALHIACPACFTPEEFPAWAAGIVNSEIAEEAAFALLSRAEAFPALFSAWIASPDALLQYAALLAAARSPRLTASWVAPAVEAVHRNATAEATVETPAEATTEATAAAISAAADTSVAPGAFVFDTSVTEASS